MNSGSGLPVLTPDEKKWLLTVARRAIAERLKSKGQFELPPLSADSPLNDLYGAFVTLNLDGELQGCIGHIIPRLPLKEEIEEIAVQSAEDDPRFLPVQPAEVERLEIEITILGHFITVESPSEILVGRDGLYIQHRFHRGLLLPQVASERGWTTEQFLSATCLKAGLPSAQWRQPGVEIQRFGAVYFGEKKLGS